MQNRIKLYYFAPHPIQYNIGIFKKLEKSNDIDFKVIFEDDMGVKPVYVKEFKKEIKWDIDLLSGYKYQFLKNYSLNNTGGFFGRINPNIISILFKNRPNVIILHGYVYLSDWMVLFISKILKIKIIFRGEATLRATENTPTLKQKLKKLFLNYWLKACDTVMYSCSGNKEYWKYYGVNESKLVSLPCAVDNIFFQNENKKYVKIKDSIKEQLNIDNDDFIVLFSARFTSRKRPLDLIRAISKIDHSNIIILFVGDGLERKNMEDEVKKHNIKAIFTGFINQTEISKYYTISDLDIVISDYDPSPKAMNEAMNFKLPIIVTDIVGTANDLVEDGENGFIVKVGDIDLISQKIDFLNKNRGIAKEMGKESLKIVNEWTFEKDVYWIEEAVKYVMEKK